MSARGSWATTRVLPEATSWATRAAVSRWRDSVQYRVLPSAVKPSGEVVSESSRPTEAIGCAATLPFVTR